MKTIKLKQGNEIPLLGLGTWKLTGEECIKSVLQALEIGYRHIDTADLYDNHESVGEGIKNSGIKREDLFLTSKVWRDDFSKQTVKDSVKRFLEELQTEYLDLVLIHWPNSDINVQEALEAFEELLSENIIKSYGVSNFTINHLKELESFNISMNQVEFHPSFNQKELFQYCKDHGIALTAYAPIARGEDLKITELVELAEKLNITVAQLIIAWLIKKGVVAIPKASSKDHSQQNFDAAAIELSDGEFEIVESVNRNNRMIIPEFAEFDY